MFMDVTSLFDLFHSVRTDYITRTPCTQQGSFSLPLFFPFLHKFFVILEFLGQVIYNNIVNIIHKDTNKNVKRGVKYGTIDFGKAAGVEKFLLPQAADP